MTNRPLRPKSRTMRDLNDFYYFVQVVDHGGFAAAARALGLQKSRLSRRIAILEEALGVRVIQRSSRRFAITEIGREFYTRCVAMLEEARTAEQVVAEHQAAPRGIVRLSCPVGLLSFQFGTMLARFLLENPAVTLHLESTNRRVDVIAEGFDVAIRVRFPPIEESELVMRKLDESTQCIVAHPSFATEGITSPADLAMLPSLSPGPAHQDHHWHLHHKDGRAVTAPHTPRLVTSDMGTLHEAALQGLGIVQLPTLLVWRDCQAGRLVRLLPEWQPLSGIVHAVFPSRRGLLPSVRMLLDFLARECAIHRERMGEFA